MKTDVWMYGLVLGALLGAGRVDAAGGTGAEFLEVQVPAAVAAQVAGVADRGGVSNLSWNPAGIVGAEYPELSMTHVASLADTAYEQLDGVVPGCWGGSLGVGVFYSGNYGLMEMDAAGEEVGTLENSNVMGSLTFARPLRGGLDAGASLKFFQSTLGSFRSQGAALDLGVRQAWSGTPLAVGGVIKHLGRMSAFDQEADPLPTLAALGVQLMGDDWGLRGFKLSGDWNWALQGEALSYATVGGEYAVRETGYVRAGYRLDHELGAFSVGGGLRWAGLGVDYAFQPYGSLGSNHRITVAYAFKPLAAPVTLPVGSAALPSGSPVLVSAEKAFHSQATKHALAFETRSVEGQTVFRQRAGSPGRIRGVRIVDAQSRVIRELPKTMAEGEWVWDGRNSAGERVPESWALFVSTVTEQGQGAALPMPQVAPVLKVSPADGSSWFSKSVFRFLHRPTTEAWSLVICEAGTSQEIRRVSGKDALPETWVWDGLQQNGDLAPSTAKYQYHLSVQLAEGLEILSGQALHSVDAQVYRGVGGRVNLVIPGVLFDFNSTVLKTEMADKLSLSADVLNQAGTAARIICEGHADEVGGVQENQRLSEQRAIMVAQCLHDRLGVNAGQLSFQGFGQARPVDSRGTEEARARNRRVEIRIVMPMAL